MAEAMVRTLQCSLTCKLALISIPFLLQNHSVALYSHFKNLNFLVSLKHACCPDAINEYQHHEEISQNCRKS